MKMNKKIQRTICMGLVLMFFLQPIKVNAAIQTRQAEWSLYYNPSAPSSTWVISAKKAFTPHKSTCAFYVNSVSNNQTYVGLKVIDYTPEYQKKGTFSISLTNLPVGSTLYTYSRLASYPNKISRASGYGLA